MTRAITNQQMRILCLILASADDRRQLSLREIGKKMGITSTNGVACHLEALRKKGLVTWDSVSGNHSPKRTLRPTCRMELFTLPERTKK
jgi:predicted ArsR family transcriptional regulator